MQHKLDYSESESESEPEPELESDSELCELESDKSESVVL